jgi:hypothetical protein
MRHLAVALVAVLAFGACSDDDDETTTDRTTSPSSRDEGERSGGSSDACDAIAVIVEWDDAVQQAISSNAGNPEAQSEALDAELLDGREEVEGAYADLSESVPDELRDDAEVLGDFTTEFLDRLAGGEAAGEIFASMGAEAEEAAASATRALDDYAREQCDMALSSSPGG